MPDASIVADQNRRLVMTVDDEGNVIPRVVDIGPKVDGYRVIRSGLGRVGENRGRRYRARPSRRQGHTGTDRTASGRGRVIWAAFS